MHLLDSELKNKEQWEKAEISLPQFDRQAMKEETKKNPQWVHFGAGNIFRAFPAALQQKLLMAKQQPVKLQLMRPPLRQCRKHQVQKNQVQKHQVQDRNKTETL